MSRAAVVGGALLAIFLYTSARADDPANSPPPSAKPNDSSKLVCKREKLTGSNIPQKVCRTQAQIDKEQAAQKEHVHERNDSTWNGPQPGGGQ